MTLDEKSAVVTDVYSFGDIVDETCKKLMCQQIKYSIRRIQEMDERLAGLERELDSFLLQKNRK